MSDPLASEWPARPYKGFANYGPEDVGLFAGRDEDVAAFSRLVARPDVRFLFLHGATGAGKSSFLRAGVIPYLERRQAGFAFLKHPDQPAIEREAPDAAAVFVRSTARPLDTLADAVFRLAEQGYQFVSPAGPEHLTFDRAQRGCTTAEQFVAGVASDPRELVLSLEHIAEELPFKLVLIVDQAEEVLTLGGRRRADTQREQFFAFLERFAETRWPLTLILSLRTEFYGTLQARLRRDVRRRDLPVHDYFLDELDLAGVVAAILRPTLTTPVGRRVAPHQVYRFSFEPGLPERIATDLADAADAEGLVGGSLPFLQIVCASLYKSTKERHGTDAPWVIAHEDYTVGRVIDVMAQYLDDILNAFLRPRGGAVDLARSRWKDVLASLAKTQPDGSMTTQIQTIEQLREQAARAVAPDFDGMIEFLAADAQSVLRRDRIANPTTCEPVDCYSLRHDALGLVLRLWSAKRETYRQQLVFKHSIRSFMPTVDRIELACRIDGSGSGEHIRRWIGVRSVQTVVNYRIPYGFGVSLHGRLPPSLIVTPLPQTASALTVRFIEAESTDVQLKGDLEICGELGRDTGFVGFETRQPFEHAFYMTRAQVEAAYTDPEWTTEYTGLFLQLPTGKLHVTVQFPEEFRSAALEAGPVVFLGSSEKTHEAEIARIRPNFRLDDITATLEVEEPLQGLQYAIYWMPPV